MWLMQDYRADLYHWRAIVAERGPGWRLWRWEEWESDQPVCRFRLLEPGERPKGLGDVIEP